MDTRSGRVLQRLHGYPVWPGMTEICHARPVPCHPRPVPCHPRPVPCHPRPPCPVTPAPCPVTPAPYPVTPDLIGGPCVRDHRDSVWPV